MFSDEDVDDLIERIEQVNIIIEHAIWGKISKEDSIEICKGAILLGLFIVIVSLAMAIAGS